MYIRSNVSAVSDSAVVRIGEMNHIVVTNGYVCKAGIRSNFAVFANNRVALKNRARMQDRIAAHFNRRIHIGSSRVD